MEQITESTTTIEAEVKDVVDKKMEIFYNPVMKLNRDISVLLLLSLQHPEQSSQSVKPLRIALPLAGSGIRGLRFLKELPKEMIKEIHINDKKEGYIKYLNKMLEMNKCQTENVFVYNKDACIFLIENKPFDYIDIDPFGTPNPFLDSAVRSLRSDGILAVTATDTSALSGTYPYACQRKYWAKPLRNELMHEIGLRILIRKVQLMGTNQQRALTPILSYSKDHYMRIFFRFDKGKKSIDRILAQHGTYMPDSERCTEDSVQKLEGSSPSAGYGPLWLGELNELETLEKIKAIEQNDECISKRTIKLIDTLIEETKINSFGFIDIHNLSKNNKEEIPKFEYIISALKKKGFFAARTHFRHTAIKTNATKKDVEKILMQKDLTKYIS